MRKIWLTLLLFLIYPHLLNAQITPSEGNELNYRIIGFSFPGMQQAAKYGIEIATGNWNNNDSFQKNIIVTGSSKKNKLVAEVPAFGQEYTWRAIYTNSHASITKSELYHFSTGMIPEVDTDSTRLRILVPLEKNKDSYVFVDGNKVMYDMNGRPVWFLPSEGRMPRVARPRDMKYSPWGTTTFMMNEQMYEINYNGNVLWKEPEITSRGKRNAKERLQNLYHHEFTHLPDGHYMTLGMESVMWELPDSETHLKYPANPRIVHDSGKTEQKILSGRIIEFDQKHNVIWSWSSAEYFKRSDLYYRRRSNGLFNIGNTHENAFFFDQKAKTIYLSFRNLNRIVKFQYPSGKVLNTYGPLYAPGDLEMDNDLFCGQHSCRRSQEGYLYIYNNNTCNRPCGQLPTIVMMQEPLTSKGHLKKVWEYKCSLDSMNDAEQRRYSFESGGNVFELPDRSIFCCMGGTYSKIFIVTRDKNIVWSALPERWNKLEKKWREVPSFRASIITRKELESLIWNEPLKK